MRHEGRYDHVRTETSKPQNRIDSLIGAGTTIEGNVIFSGGLRVDGMVRGNVIAADDQPGTLVVSEQARIDGEVQRLAHRGERHDQRPGARDANTLELQPKAQGQRGRALQDLEIQLGAVVRAAGASTRGASPTRSSS